MSTGQILASCELTNVQFSMFNSYPKKGSTGARYAVLFSFNKYYARIMQTDGKKRHVFQPRSSLRDGV